MSEQSMYSLDENTFRSLIFRQRARIAEILQNKFELRLSDLILCVCVYIVWFMQSTSTTRASVNNHLSFSVQIFVYLKFTIDTTYMYRAHYLYVSPYSHIYQSATHSATDRGIFENRRWDWTNSGNNNEKCKHSYMCALWRCSRLFKIAATA